MAAQGDLAEREAATPIPKYMISLAGSKLD